MQDTQTCMTKERLSKTLTFRLDGEMETMLDDMRRQEPDLPTAAEMVRRSIRAEYMWRFPERARSEPSEARDARDKG